MRLKEWSLLDTRGKAKSENRTKGTIAVVRSEWDERKKDREVASDGGWDAGPLYIRTRTGMSMIKMHAGHSRVECVQRGHQVRSQESQTETAKSILLNTNCWL